MLHHKEGNGMEEAMEELVARSQNDGQLSSQASGDTVPLEAGTCL